MGVILDYEMWSFVVCIYVRVVVSVIWDEQLGGGVGWWGEDGIEEKIKRNKGAQKRIVSHTLQRHSGLHLLLKSRT